MLFVIQRSVTSKEEMLSLFLQRFLQTLFSATLTSKTFQYVSMLILYDMPLLFSVLVGLSLFVPCFLHTLVSGTLTSKTFQYVNMLQSALVLRYLGR